MTWHGGQEAGAGTGLGGLLEPLGDRVARRAEPRFGIALAGVGMLMIIIGIVVWAGERLARETDLGEADPDNTLGILLTMLVIAAGYLLLLRFRRGPLATAGVVASALGIPVLLAFATFDSPTGDPEAYLELPFSVDAIVVLSLIAWLVNHAVVPVARGRIFYLAASTFLLWLYVLEKAEEGAAGYILGLPFGSFLFPFYFGGFEEEIEGPEPGTIGGASLVFGIVYYLAAVVLDRRGHQGTATPFAVAGLVTTALGIAHLGGDLEALGTGVLLVVIGTALAVYGATQGRRFTTWAWSAGVGLGVLLIVGDLFEETAAGFGVSAIVLGAGVVLAAHVITGHFTEPDEMTPGPSRFTPRRPGPRGGAWVAYAPSPGGSPWARPYPAGPPVPAATPPPAQPWPDPPAHPGTGPTGPTTPLPPDPAAPPGPATPTGR